MAEKATAAFFRVEGALIPDSVLAASAYVAANAPGFGERVFRLGQVALSAPVYAFLGQTDRVLANRIAYLPYRNLSEDRIVLLAQEYFDDVLKDKILERGLELLDRARAEGHRIVLLSDGLAHVIEPLARHLKHVDYMACNHLEFRDGTCTGRLLEPVVGGHNGGRWATRFAADHDLDLARSTAFASHGPDVMLLAAVGRPCVVNPDFALRSAAREADWPILEYGD